MRRLLSTYQDLTFCKEYDLIRRFPCGVRTEFTDFEFSTENNVIENFQEIFIFCSEYILVYTLPRQWVKAVYRFNVEPSYPSLRSENIHVMAKNKTCLRNYANGCKYAG